MQVCLLLLCTLQLMAGVVIKETCPGGFSLEVHIDSDRCITELIFSDGVRVCYEYEDRKLCKIVRCDSFGRELYAQTYDWDGSKLISQTGWFTTRYVYDDYSDRVIAKLNPWHQEIIEYDSSGKPIRIGDKTYSYDVLGEITSEHGYFHAIYDEACNLIELNGEVIAIDEYNKVVGCNYDAHGNLLKDGFIYDDNHQLIEVSGERYAYDSYGRLIQKGNTFYLYLGCEEIASFENGQCKTLKIPAIGGPIAIEINGQPYAPVIDAQGIIRKLISPATGSVYKENDCDIFGGGLTDAIPYAYRGKRYDPLTGLVYFGKRYYDPSLRRWLTPDPLGSIDHENLYQYVYNNPLQYCDPTGGSLWGYMLGLGEIVAGGALMVGGMGLELATLGGFTFGFAIVEGAGFALMTDGLVRATTESRDMQMPQRDTNHKASSHVQEIYKQPPRFNGKDLGSNPSECPGEGFEWRGKGPPESGKGNWLNPATGEKLHPDLEHPAPKGPHWGYKDSNGTPYDLFPDGNWQ